MPKHIKMIEQGFNSKAHWENVYTQKNTKEVSWYQAVPKVSLRLIDEFKIPKDANIIDVGGGDGLLVDFLLDEGFSNITVLDISDKAIKNAKERLGEKAKQVTWIVSNIVDFEPKTEYAFWHDRATFHFLIDEKDVRRYLKIVEQSIALDGVLAVGTFSIDGPKKCSGIDVKQYDENSLSGLFQSNFNTIKCFREGHQTPFGTVQDFLFCTFKRANK